MRAKPEPQHSPQFRGLHRQSSPVAFLSRNESPAPPPSLPHRDHRHFFGAAAILTRLGEYGGAHQALKHGLPSKHKHFAVQRRRFATKAHIRESLFAAARRTTPGSSLVQQDNAQATRPHVTANNSSQTHRRYLPEAHIVTENSPSSVFICTCFCSHFLPPASAPLK